MTATVLIVGSGGREHALALAVLASPNVREVVLLPGNGGTARSASAPLRGKVLRNASGTALEAARQARADLVIVGPEAPLCAGLADELSAAGFLVFGPKRGAAALEGSKAFMKEFAERHGLRTARHVVVRDAEQVERAVFGFDEPPVVKADGLCAGKGVVVAETHEAAIRAARAMLSGERFGAAGSTVVIEERLRGAEASVHAICDGTRALMLPPAQDHKRIGEGDTGPNTGGMGTYAPAPLVTPSLLDRIEHEIISKTLRGMQAEGMPYVGTLFAGLMISPGGEPVLLEFNVRFGDPETQVLMNTIDGDLFEALSSAAAGRIVPGSVRPSRRHAVCVVLAAAGYPDTPRTGDVIGGLADAEALDGVKVYHAGTRFEAGQVLTAGGRVLGVTAAGDTLGAAHALAYRAADLIQFEGKQMRRDIAARALAADARA